ncbi:hypothetical protein [Acidomonas methanolica]|uniref:hypothetical protein n=1 Tax=Acidomonas methanolica TaxID=437 RepID=UPI00211A448B|nr:hypothetical protein [Acidomonas methanolica]MCQ9156794.1 hypothetical protein [Acidomonas methanolica]
MISRLSTFVNDLGCNPTLMKEFRANPRKVAVRAGFTGAELELLSAQDGDGIHTALRKRNAAFGRDVTVVLIVAPEISAGV